MNEYKKFWFEEEKVPGIENMANNLFAISTARNENILEVLSNVGIVVKDTRDVCRIVKELKSDNMKAFEDYYNCPKEVLLTNDTDPWCLSEENGVCYPYAASSLSDAINKFLAEASTFEGESDVLLRRCLPQTIRNTLQLFSKEDTKFRAGLDLYSRNSLGIGRSAYKDRPYLQFSNDNFKNYIGFYFDNDRSNIVLALHSVSSEKCVTDRIEQFKGIMNKRLFEDLTDCILYNTTIGSAEGAMFEKELRDFYIKLNALV